MPLIHECVVTTLTQTGKPHIAPLGLIEDGENWIIAPFRPSTTLTNLYSCNKVTASFTDNALIFAKLVTGNCEIPLLPILSWPAPRLADALAHAELEVIDIVEDDLRPRFVCKVRRIETYNPFLGMNRARAAVLEAAILSTRLNRLSREKIDQEIAYLKIAIDKTAGPIELEAWQLVLEKINTL